MIKINLCITDLPEAAVKTSEKNGKNYVELILNTRKTVSEKGDTHVLYISQSKVERENGVDKIYVGGGKETIFENKPIEAPAAADLSLAKLKSKK